MAIDLEVEAKVAVDASSVCRLLNLVLDIVLTFYIECSHSNPAKSQYYTSHIVKEKKLRAVE